VTAVKETGKGGVSVEESSSKIILS